MTKWRWLLVPLVCCWLAQPAAAVPFVPDFSEGPVVFDFEDGLQGWDLTGSAQRVQTQVVGGEWAIFGDGLVPPAELGIVSITGAGVWMDIDLTDVAALSFEQFFAGDAAQGTDFVIAFTLLDIVEAIFFSSFPPTESPDPTANPGLRVADLTGVSGVHTMAVSWGFCFTDHFPTCPTNDPAIHLGFIDNITLYPIPEPSTALLVAAGLAGLAAAGRRRQS